MPRPQTAKSSARSADDDSKRAHQKDTKQLLSEVLGGDPEFAETFFGESHNMTRMLQARSANHGDGDVSMNGAEGANGTRDAEESSKQIASNGSGHRRVPRHVGNSAITIENTPHDIDHLIICQLQEDLDSYRYDVDFCKTQLDPEHVGSITPAEVRTFQLRLLDLGHQMRSIHHRIQVMQAVINNSFYSGSHAGSGGAATANTYFGAYPPGTNIQGCSATGPSTPYDSRQGRSLQRSSAYAAYNEGLQDRRGPGRPLGSKNRSRPPPDALQAAAAGNVGSAKAAALASAGAKRTLPSEILVATTNEDADTDGGAGLAIKPKPGKRPRLDADVDSPTSNNADGQYQGEPSTSAVHAEIRDSDETGSISGTSDALAPSADHALGVETRLPSTPIVVAQPTNTFTSANRPPSGDSAYTRLGRWMCTLCTSQKYLKHPPPKQPAEPSSWALRDISKIVTHFTRMHTEHTDVERCQELGNALGTNVGPFTYWIRVTKKTPVSDEEVQQAITEMNEGKLPDLLRRLSAAAAKFPGRN